MVIVAIWVRVTTPEPPRLSGERTTRTYDLADFDGVDVGGQWQVTVERGDAWRVSVEMPAEVSDQVRVERNGDALHLRYSGPGLLREFDRGNGALKATITMPALERVAAAGTTQLSFSGFEGSSLSLDISGGVNLRGTASRYDSLTLDLSGAGNLDLGGVSVTDATVDISGAGSVTLRMAGGRLSGDLSGAASLEYYGTVSAETIDKSGLVNVRRRN
jgi:hypothetical protein